MTSRKTWLFTEPEELASDLERPGAAGHDDALGSRARCSASSAPVNVFNVDAWDGYQVARDRVMTFLADNQISNPVVLTGDIHSVVGGRSEGGLRDPGSPIVGAEFVCSGITSVFGDANVPPVMETLPVESPHPVLRWAASRVCAVHGDPRLAGGPTIVRSPGCRSPFFTVPSADHPALRSWPRSG